MTEYTTQEVIDELKKMSGQSTNTGLAAALGSERQNLHQFKQGKQQDIKMKMIAFLIDEVKRLS